MHRLGWLSFAISGAAPINPDILQLFQHLDIPLFGYNWMPSHVWRTAPKIIRSGTVVTAFDYESAKQMPISHGREYTESELWANLEEWIKIITPEAEAKNIRLGIHPCDQNALQIKMRLQTSDRKQ